MTTKSENNVRVYGDVCLRKQRRKRQKSLVTDLLLDYARNSTLHGLRYVAEKGITTIEKLFWILTFAGSIILCSLLIKNVYNKWKTSPVIVTVSERLISVGEMPFPSVTICPQIKSKATVYNYSQKYANIIKNTTNVTLQDREKLADVSILCRESIEYDDISNRTNTGEGIIKNIDDVSPMIDDVLLFCNWLYGKENDCHELFRKVYTAEGLCFNFNGLTYEEMFRDTVQSRYEYSERRNQTEGWSLEGGYTGTKKYPYPRKGSENGAHPDLVVILKNKLEYSNGLCNGLNSGYKIYIHHPTDHPQSSLFYYAALDGQVSSIAVSANVLNSPTSLTKYSVETRQCYFQDDRRLRYFKIYTASNCRAECLSNYTYKPQTNYLCYI